MPRGAHVRITSDSVRGREARIIINGQDIGGCTRDIQVSFPLNGPITARIEVLVEHLELDTDALLDLQPYLAQRPDDQRL